MRYVTGEDSSRRGRKWEWLLTREGEGSDDPKKGEEQGGRPEKIKSRVEGWRK